MTSSAVSPIVITGIGILASSGLTADEVWAAAQAGICRFGPSQRLDTTGYPYRAVAETPAFALLLRQPKNEKFMSPAVRCAMGAAQQAMKGAGLAYGSVESGRLAIHVGSGQSGIENANFFIKAMELAERLGDQSHWRDLGGRPSRLIDPYFGLRTLSNAGTGLLSLEFGARGPSSNFVQSDTASAHAVATGFHDLRAGRCDVALVGGYDSLLTVSALLTFHTAGLLSDADPGLAYRPFDRARRGLVLGEGAGFLVLEREEDAQQRGVRPLARIVGVGEAMEPGDTLQLKASAKPLTTALQQAWTRDRSSLNFVVAHGLGTVRDDAQESQLLAEQFGPDMAVTAFKGSTGYIGAATAAVELALTACALSEGVIPPIAGLSVPDEGVTLDFVTGTSRAIVGDSAAALCLSWSQGGQCSAIALENCQSG